MAKASKKTGATRMDETIEVSKSKKKVAAETTKTSKKQLEKAVVLKKEAGSKKTSPKEKSDVEDLKIKKAAIPKAPAVSSKAKSKAQNVDAVEVITQASDKVVETKSKLVTPELTTKPKKNEQKAILPKSDKTKELKVTEEIIAEPVESNVVNIEVVKVLQPSEGETPIYSVADDANAKKEIAFAKIVANDEILEVLSKNGFKEVSTELHKILQAGLRGSNSLVIANSVENAFLIATIPSVYKILSGSFNKGEIKKPSVIVFADSDGTAENYFKSSQNLFSELNIKNSFLSAKYNELDFENPVDILFTTVESFDKANKSLGIKLDSVSLCVFYGLQNSVKNNSNILKQILDSLVQERVQKIFIAEENTPRVRELAFSYLSSPEYFYFLPLYVKERFPKQFAHAIPATQKFQVLLGHLKTHKPNCAIVFANTRAVAEWIAFKLHGNAIKVQLLDDDFNHSKRPNLLKSIKSGEVNVLIATDYFCNSLGIEELNCIYHFDLPNNPQKFLDRLNLIEGAKSPISVSFICEDYGYNMGKIEEALGLKIYVATPDKNYFSLKDISEYPLEADGRVKKIGTPSTLATESQQPASAPQEQMQARRVVETTEPRVEQKPAYEYKIPQARPADRVKPVERTDQVRTTGRPDSQFFTRSDYQQQNKFEPKYQDKYVRRDEKAKEAIDSARMAAQEKKKAATSQRQHEQSSEKKGILSLAVHIVQDALKAASDAAKQSVATNIEENMPVLVSLLNKVPFLKKKDK